MSMLAHKKIIGTSWLAATAAVIMPDIIFGLLIELFHLLLEATHLLFELFESALDHMVEHLFHTETKETQIIVFYLMMTMGLSSSYFLFRKIKQGCSALNNAILDTVLDIKTGLSHYWLESAHNKFKLIAGINVALTVIYLVGF
jgi:hypothetical protein